MQAQSQTLQTTLTSTQERVAELNTQRDQLERQLAEANQAREALDAELRQRISQLESDVRDAKDQRNALGVLLRETRTEKDQLASTLQQLKIEQLGATQTDQGLQLTLGGDLSFEINSTALKAAALERLAPLASYLRDNPQLTASIAGHTDDRGPAAYNLNLSQQRADAVKNYLTEQGIAEDRLLTQGFGETQPIASNGTAAGRQQNRRVEIVLQ